MNRPRCPGDSLTLVQSTPVGSFDIAPAPSAVPTWRALVGLVNASRSTLDLTAMYMDETIPEEQMPLRMVGVSQCFRREVGSHGQSDLGIWRVHQFTKIEQIIISKPEDSWALHEELLQNCVDLWNSLGIHYEVVNICTGDMGTVAAKKYDLEAWIPGAKQYKEIVSCSNCTDYQANRLGVRYGQPGHPNQPIVHTLNSTAVATSRALVAIMEQYQLEDGRVAIPDVLQPYMGGQEVLETCPWG